MEEKNTGVKKKSAIAGTVILVIIIVLLVITSFGLYKMRSELNEKQTIIERLRYESNEQQTKAQELEATIKNLIDTQAEVLRSTARILHRKNIQNIEEQVDWNTTLENIVNMEPGSRKVAVFTSILLAIKEIRFRLGGQSPQYGFDSPGFVKYVLSYVGIEVEKEPNKYLSVTMMEKFQKVDSPRPGDLMFFEGNPGNFVLFYLSPGKEGGLGVGAGHLGRNMPTGVYDSFPFKGKFKGYYRVNYQDEN